MRTWHIAVLLVALYGCASSISLPGTMGEKKSGFSYVPLDPLEIYEYARSQTCCLSGGCGNEPVWRSQASDRPPPGYEYIGLLEDFPDMAVRLSIMSFDAKSGLSFGGSSVGVKGNSYHVVLDVINADNVPIPFDLEVKIEVNGERAYSAVRKYSKSELETMNQTAGMQPREDAQESRSESTAKFPVKGEYSIPVYVGIGLRLTADITVIKGKVNLASLGALAASAEAGNSVGTLTIQTLGVSGSRVLANLPLPSKLNQTTVEQAITSIASIKALLDNSEEVYITPRVTGIFLPVKDGSVELVNLITSELAELPIPWGRNCRKIEKEP